MFWIISAVFIVIALAFILPPLKQRQVDQDASREQNILIAQEQLAELESRFEKGEIDQESYQSTRDELEQSLFSDIKDTENNLNLSNKNNSSSRGSLISTTIILLLIPVISFALYFKVGNLNFTKVLDSSVAAEKARDATVPKNADGTPDIDTMVAGLQKKLEEKPDNPRGWFMLGRSYMVLERYTEAANAFDSALKLTPQSANIMLSLADALSMSNQGQIIGRPAELVEKALQIEPNNLTALWLSGMAARQQGQHLKAIAQWNKVLPLITDQPQQIFEVNRLISEAKSQLTPEQSAALPANSSSPNVEQEKASATTEGIKVTVSISDAFKDKANPTDLVFIYAKAMSGPPMPLAAVRKQVKDLPIDVVLNDEMAMMPNLKLSSFSDVIVGARVSKSGQPIAQNGDLYSEKTSVKSGENVTLEINSVLSK